MIVACEIRIEIFGAVRTKFVVRDVFYDANFHWAVHIISKRVL